MARNPVTQRWTAAGLAALALTLSACAGAPKPVMAPLAKAGYGYQEAKLGAAEWEVSYHGVVRFLPVDGERREIRLQAAIARSRELALWRAAQVVAASGAASFDVVREGVNTKVRQRPGTYEHPYWPAPYYHPYAYPYRHYPSALYPYYSYSPPVAYGRAWVTLRIRAHRDPRAGRYNAAAYRARMRAKYGPAIPPPR